MESFNGSTKKGRGNHPTFDAVCSAYGWLCTAPRPRLAVTVCYRHCDPLDAEEFRYKTRNNTNRVNLLLYPKTKVLSLMGYGFNNHA